MTSSRTGIDPLECSARERPAKAGYHVCEICNDRGRVVNFILIAVGGALGSVARYLVSLATLRAFGPAFPAGTFVVNALGCLIFGLIVGAAGSRFELTPSTRAFLLVGLLGGFTTFSSYVYESAELMRTARFGAAALNVAGQVVIGLAAFWAGVAAAAR